MAVIETPLFRLVIPGKWERNEAVTDQLIYQGKKDQLLTINVSTLRTGSGSAYDHDSDMADLRRIAVGIMNRFSRDRTLKEVIPMTRHDMPDGTKFFELVYRTRDQMTTFAQYVVAGPNTVAHFQYTGSPEFDDVLKDMRQLIPTVEWVSSDGHR